MKKTMRLFEVYIESVYVCAANEAEAVAVAREKAEVALVTDVSDDRQVFDEAPVINGKGHSKCRLCRNVSVATGDPGDGDSVAEWQSRYREQCP